jgi:predicted membrane protein
MRRATLFWGFILILLGAILLLQNLGIITVNLWSIFIPVLIIAFGVWILWGSLSRKSLRTEHFEIPFENIKQANLRIQHGAGRLTVKEGVGEGLLVAGDCIGGVSTTTSSSGDRIDIKLSVPDYGFSWLGWTPSNRLDWDLKLTQNLPLSLVFETGAAETQIDLRHLIVRELRLSSGASSTRIDMPANARNTTATIKTGAASVDIRIPEGVSARIRATGGLSSITVDRHRFPASDGKYQSTDYDSATNKVDIEIAVGVGSVDIR